MFDENGQEKRIKIIRKKKCKHDEKEWVKLPKGFTKEDLKGLNGDSKIGMDGLTSVRIDDMIRDCIAYHVPDHEGVFLIKKKFGIELSIPAYYNRKSKLSSDVEIQSWLNAYARSGFVREHILDMDRMRLSIEMTMQALHVEQEKPHDERDWKLIGQLQRELRESTRMAVQLRLGAPVMARIKAMINTQNIEVIENDPNLSADKKKKLLRGVPDPKTALVIGYTGEENTGGENVQKTAVVASRELKKSENGGSVGVVMKHKNNGIDWEGVEQDLKGEIVSNNKEIVIDPENINNESHTGDSDERSDVRDSQSFFKYIMENGEGSVDDIIPKRNKSGLDSIVEGKTSMEVGSDTR